MTDAPVTAEVVPYRPAAALSVPELAGLIQTVEAAKRDALRDGTDFGLIPNTGDRPTLLKPGAERLLLLFGLSHDMAIDTERKDERPFRVTAKCTVRRGELVVASCYGTADYDETRFHTARRAGTGGREKPEWWAPWNTLVKMAQKRALVGAALQATGSSGLFGADLEDAPEAASEADAAALALNWIENLGGVAIKKLPDPVRGELKRRLPWSKEWTVDNWIVALIEAGRIDAEREAQIGGSPASDAAT